MHRLLLPPARRLEGVIRMPELQDAHGRATTQFLSSLMPSDALRRVKTTASNRVCVGPLSTPQMFVTAPSGGVNTHGAMIAGAHKMNSRRLVSKTRGASAGIE
ncbi:MAG: hypothetical protein ACR2QA_09210 [Solirubrobacteraceae bacterium]